MFLLPVPREGGCDEKDHGPTLGPHRMRGVGARGVLPGPEREGGDRLLQGSQEEVVGDVLCLRFL